MPPRPALLRRGALAALIAATVALPGCRDALTPELEPNRARRNTTPSYTSTFGLANDTTPAHSMALQSFPEKRAVQITVTGAITAVHLPDASQNRKLYPHGWACHGTVAIKYGGTTVANANCNGTAAENPAPYEPRVVVQGAGEITRGGAWSSSCYGSPGVRCWSYEGTQQVTIKVLDVKGIPKASARTLPNAGNVNFWWEFESGTPSGTPYQTFEWWFVPADGTQTVYYTPWNGNTSIWYYVVKSGTMHVRVKANGIEQELKSEVFVGKSNLQLTAKPMRVIKGKNARFTASVSPAIVNGQPLAFSIQSWAWKDAGSWSPACAGTASTCVWPINRSGTMRAIGTVNNGQLDTATVNVNAFACDTTGVPEYDDLDMRDSLTSFWNRRRAMGPLGKEGTAVINPDGVGGFFFEELPPLSSTACAYTLPSPFPTRLVNGILIHSHFETTPAGTTIPMECRSDCVLDPDTQRFSCSMGTLDTKVPIDGDPSTADWQYHRYRTDFPDRAGTISIDGATISQREFDPSKFNDSNPSRKRFDRSNWGSCMANPI